MGLLVIKKITLLFVLISASLFSASFAGGRWRFVEKQAIEDIPEKLMGNEETVRVHERMLKVHTKDYGSYDPAPALGKPPFKLIPN